MKEENDFKILFIENTKGTNPFKVELDRPLDYHDSLELMEWTVSGVPSTTGIPDQITIWLQVDGISQYSIISNSTGRGMPLSMTSPLTHIIYNPPLQISKTANKLKQTFEIRLANPDNSNLLFDQCTLKLRFK